MNLAFSADGHLVVSGCRDHRVFSVDRSGSVEVLAGADATGGFSGDGGPGISAAFACPWGLVFDDQGNLFLVDHLNNRVRRIDREGVVTTVVESDETGASDANLHEPTWIAIDAEGQLYIADRGNDVVRRAGTDGVVTTFAGGGPDADSDGGSATESRLDDPAGIAVDQAGNVYVSDSNNARIRKIDRAGIISTIAGTGKAGYSGDGGPASRAQISNPGGLAFDPSGNLYVADSDNHVVRRIDPAGIITTVVGTGETGCPVDGKPATRSRLTNVYSVAIDPRGRLFLTDEACQGVFLVGGNGAINAFAPSTGG